MTNNINSQRGAKEGKNMSHHGKLSSVCPSLPMDYAPWGKIERWADPNGRYPDCSHGCVHFYEVATKTRERLGLDWGVCTNPKSHRCGLLTFEHQGCQQAELKSNWRRPGRVAVASGSTSAV